MPMAERYDFDVVVVGAGPVGLLLAVELGRRGARTLLVEQLEAPSLWPKFDRCNARTMEIFRRLGLAERVRALGYPPEAPMDVFIVTRLADPPLLHQPYPSVAERRAKIAATTDGSEPLEPYQLVSQNRIEPLLKDVAEGTPNVTVRYGCRLTGFEQDETGVTVALESKAGAVERVRVQYLAGCDGGRSLVRRTLDIPLEGQAGTRDVHQICFGSPDLYDLIPIGKGRHYYIADAEGSTLVVQGSRDEFTLNTNAPEGSDIEAIVRDRVGFPFTLEVRNVGTWRRHLLLADRYRDGRVFIAGDAAHQVIPTGGLGMNTGIGDAIDLAWKLAGTIAGWGGPGLLESYDHERRRVGARNREASTFGAQGVLGWRSKVRADVIRDEGPEGEAARAEVVAAARANHRRMHEMIGAEIGYTYAGSPIVAQEPGNPEEWDIVSYVPHSRPGVRILHVWLKDGRAIQDLLGPDYTLLDLTGETDGGELVSAFTAIGAPLRVVGLREPRIREIYGCALLLVRPDLHIVWRGDALPQDAAGLAALATGHAVGHRVPNS
jgi:2-polyprenyl-6-methoxyphenol hydroxylase-like FAD-dependent oxidoreductase